MWDPKLISFYIGLILTGFIFLLFSILIFIIFDSYKSIENIINIKNSDDLLSKIINEEFVIPESEQPKPLEVPSEADLAFHEEIVSELLRYITDPLLRAEYLREIGQFEEASLVLKDANPEDEFLKFYKQKIQELITKRDRSVVELIYEYGFTIVM